MNLKLKRINPLQAGKMLGALYGLISLVFVPFVLVMVAMGSFAAKSQGAGTALPLFFGLGFLVFLPVVYAIMGFLFGMLAAWVYNLLTRWLGGFELEFEPIAPPLP